MIEGAYFTCDECGTRLPITATHAKHVTSCYVKARRGGGANAVFRAVYDGQVICAGCFMKGERGEQGALF